ncbi:MAG TPA: MBL fold metallo-hydrolase [Kribbellaceae bacterium]
MRTLTVLGSCGAWPEAGRACSGFLLEYDGFRVLLDLGYAALPRLLEVCPDGAVDAVLVTHRHPDHCVDVSGLGRVVQDLAPHAVPLPLYAAPPQDRPRTLMTAAEAGEWAAKARARRLLLTHFWPGSDRAVSVAEAAAGFGGEILAAEEGLVVEL